ncbi:hypothetical protein FRC02_001140 [Tulasnella sp. 418]|nr:hypothetical protein FRC02_001140 [Tulasnella sp. 418]
MAYRQSNESGLPLSNPNYHAANTDPRAMYNDPDEKKAGMSKWIKFGVPVAIVIIVAAVVGGVVGSKASDNNKGNSSSSQQNGGNNGNSGPGGQPNESELASIKSQVGLFATSTNSFNIPIYPSTTNAAAFTTPTFITGDASKLTWPKDPAQFAAQPAPTSVRTDRPRIVAPAYKWEALPNLIANDPYMKAWNDSIIALAQKFDPMDPVPYLIDGGLGKSGVLDVAREVKQRVKAFAYAYKATGQTMWADRAWRELHNASGKGTQPFGEAGNNWNTQHFLDVAEFTAAFAIGYDWLYDVWTDDQKTLIRTAIIDLGLKYGVAAYGGEGYGWWRNVNGNWNCVCNGGLTLGALAILGDDTSGVAEQILGLTVPNAALNCGQGPSTDGTWSETANYWYFGTTAHAEMASSLLSATGSTYDLLDSNPTFADTGRFHIYVSGNQQMFDYGDHGPNKFSTTANSMIFYGSQYNKPVYTLFQRDRPDSHGDPWAIFWYDPAVTGAWWNGLQLDHYFDDPLDVWTSMRSSWTDNTGLYVAMKAGNHTGHQAHGNLDAGDFVIDAMGVRWAGELGSGDYLADGYFSGEDQASERWLYYRTRTEGQNTLVLGHQNQVVSANTPSKFESSGTAQGSSTVFDVPGDSTAYFTTDLTATYSGVSIKRGIRLINGRKQVLLQDDITGATTEVQWRMHTNATIALSGPSATLTLEGKTMQVSILNPPEGAAFQTLAAERYPDDPAFPAGQSDQPNPGVSVLAITLPAGSYNLQVLFNPQWPGMAASDFKTPGFIALDSWSLTSHN